MFLSTYMDDDLLAVGRWTDDRAPNQSTVTRPHREDSKSPCPYPSAEPHLRESRASKADYAGLSQESHRNRLSKSEDELLDTHPRDAIKAVRAAQMIQRQHPACFVEAEGGQQGNEATAKSSGNLLRVERHFIKQVGVYLPLDGHEVKFRPVYWTER
ncbi:hypothetical protein F4859DRAFT_47558 [Xylaria cf. heliscus]|nr:hypothetical protein F4859DRAFT_47558 [Xylaria cf. heliscus]